jgi:hypothetical protein
MARSGTCFCAKLVDDDRLDQLLAGEDERPGGGS